MIQNLINGNKLTNRYLSYDGDSILEPDKIIDLLLDNVDISNIYTSEINNDINQYNLTTINKITVKNNNKELDYSWNIPKKYLELNVLEYVLKKYMAGNNKCTGRYNRILYEIKKFTKYELLDFLRTLIYIQETFESKNIIKGVGRGSSVASYVLYIIGIHIIDSYKYKLDFDEFIRDEEFSE